MRRNRIDGGGDDFVMEVEGVVEIRSNDDGGMAKGDESLRISRFMKTKNDDDDDEVN